MSFIRSYRQRIGSSAGADLLEAIQLNTMAINGLRESMEERLNKVTDSQEAISRRFSELWRRANGYPAPMG
jgi:hypothetical protein